MLEGVDQLKLTGDKEARFRWVLGAVERLEDLAVEEQQYEILSRCAHVFPQNQIDKLGDVYQKAREGRGDGLEAVDAVIAFMETAIRNDLGGVYNVGSGSGASLNQLLALVSEITGESPNVQRMPRRSFDVDSIVLNIDKARRDSGWAPVVPLREGCERYWHWLRGD